MVAGALSSAAREGGPSSRRLSNNEHGGADGEDMKSARLGMAIGSGRSLRGPEHNLRSMQMELALSWSISLSTMTCAECYKNTLKEGRTYRRELGNLITKRFQIAAEMGANVIFDGLNNLGRCFVFLDKALDFVDGKAAQRALKLRADGAGNSGGAGTDGGKNHKNKRKARNHDVAIFCHSSNSSTFAFPSDLGNSLHPFPPVSPPPSPPHFATTPCASFRIQRPY